MKQRNTPARRAPRQRPPLSIVYRAIAELTANPVNPRAHSSEQIDLIGKSILEFGFNAPLLVDARNEVIAGNGRLAAAIKLGLREVPTVCLDHLTPQQKKAYAIADNRMNELSSWDGAFLAGSFAELSSIDLDFDVTSTGFSMGEIDVILQPAEEADGPDPDDATVELEPTVSRLGDVWQLGPDHRIVCGDALLPETYERLMPGERAAMAFFDPPYNVRIAGNVSGLGKKKHGEFVQASGELSSAAFTDFLRSAFRLAVRYSDDGSLHYVCSDWRHAGEYLDAASGVYSEVKNCCVWDKGTGGMGSLYRSQHEWVWVFKAGKASHTNNVQLGRYGRTRTNIWRYPGQVSFARATDEGNLLDLHPTVKPVALIADAIMDASARRDIVLDPFAGSGSTIIAAERVGRQARAIELDPKYVDVAVRRYERLTGRSAVHARLQLTFAEVRELREEGGHE